MNLFREQFYITLQEMLRVSSEPFLQDSLPLSKPSNISARVLRLGLAVTAFSMLEKYIQHIFDDLVILASASPVPYGDLSDDFREFIVVDAITGINNKLNFIKSSADRISFINSEILKIAKFKDNPPTYTAHGFNTKGSNINHENIKRAFAAFGYKDAWTKMNLLAASLGSANLSLVNEFQNLAKARHRAAHDPVSSLPVSDLQANIRASIIIGICVDICSNNVGNAIKISLKSTDISNNIKNIQRPIRFLDLQSDGKWREHTKSTSRAVKIHTEKTEAINVAANRREKPFVVVRDASLLPIELGG